MFSKPDPKPEPKPDPRARPPKDVIEFLNAWNSDILGGKWKALSAVAVADAEAEGQSIEVAWAETHAKEGGNGR